MDREEIRQQAEEYRQQFRGAGYHISSMDIKEAFEEGAEWMQKKMIEKACEWLINNWREYVYQDGDGIVHFGHWETDFRKAMEDSKR